MTLRTATASDLAAIMDLERTSFPTDAWSEAMMSAELASPHGRYVVDESGGRLLGYAGVRAVQGAGDADIQTIAIAEAARGHGRGRALLTELLRTAHERGAREVFLEVRADNPVATALYASEGFTEIARRPRYYQPDDVDAVVMQLDLAGWAAHAAGGDATPADTSTPQPAGTIDGKGWC
ncbi:MULTISPECIES: ribosomal protein S18-alanine N-acetyltransferase [Microbacterium]|uniref:Ribosomal-protein-alanine N-acetyltransferase n=1 Tax=Microbacterium saccharophilum TaxID=1213358 RepID=A0A7Z7CZ21_9MICO|nr:MULTISPECIES: ribosomal protein S18-alanine N-acetyltransferase [Microbacterium]SFI68154.1 ribosomal-protein-alanine N-acetyltransferase [Microbacterium saccharophilum]